MCKINKMADKQYNSSISGKSPLYQLFISLLIVLGAGILLFTFFLLAGMLIFKADLGILGRSYSEVGAKDIAFLRYILISQQISFFIIPAVIILILLNPAQQFNLNNIKVPGIKEIFLVIILSFCLFPVTSFTGQLNSGMQLPEWLSGVEQWMVEKEDSTTRLFDVLMAPDTFWTMIFNILMLALIPAIGEELIFRGVFQKILAKLFKSGHLAIWFTAFIFSTLHFQFFGFIPRFILGLVFGYLYFWSGTLWLPVIAHFVNNAVPTIGVYLQGPEKYSTPQDTTLWTNLTGLVLPVIISLLILNYFRNKSKKEAEIKINQAQLTNI